MKNRETPSPPFMRLTDLRSTAKEIKEAAVDGETDKLIKLIKDDKKKPIKTYLWIFPDDPDDWGYNCGNIFHLAARREQEELIEKVIEALPLAEKQILLLQPRAEDDKGNPLHLAAYYGYLGILNKFLDVCKSLPLGNNTEKPWLQKDEEGRIPCFVAVDGGEEECALALLEMDMEETCKMTSKDGSGLLYNAVSRGFYSLAMKILNSSIPYNSQGYKGNTPLHIITNCTGDEGKEICDILLKNDSKLIEKQNEYEGTILHSWADDYELWPFQYLLHRETEFPGVKKVFAELVAKKNKKGSNPLHRLVSHKNRPDERLTDVAKLLIDIYNSYYKHGKASATTVSDKPWLAVNDRGHTPFSLAIEHKYEGFAMHLLEIDENILVDNQQKNPLFVAIKKGCTRVADKILKTIVKNGKGSELLIDSEGETALHLAPLLNKDKDIFNRLLNGYSYLLDKKKTNGENVLHYWLKEGAVWQLDDLLKKGNKSRETIIRYMGEANKNDEKRNNPLHIAAESANETTLKAVQLLVSTYKEDNPNWASIEISKLPWFQKNSEGDGPLHVAICKKNEKFASFILSLHVDLIGKLLDYYLPAKHTLFCAIMNECSGVTFEILKKLDRQGWNKYAIDRSTKQTFLHYAAHCKNESFGKELLLHKKADIYISKEDEDENTPLEEACNIGAAWFINTFREKYSTQFEKEMSNKPLPWITSCENGHVPAILAIISEKNPLKFRDHCVEQKDTPLHHIRLSSLWEYEEFFKVKMNKDLLKDLLNIQDCDGDTPLHMALRNEDINLAQILLNMENIRTDIKGSEDKDAIKLNIFEKTVKYLRHFINNLFTLDKQSWDSADENKMTATEKLSELCHNEPNRVGPWNSMCEKVGFDPDLATSYVGRRTNLIDVRNSLFIVAALLATITFTAGFTLPGGTDNGSAIWAKEIAFFVFMIANTLAMCSSMLVLILLVYSMVHTFNVKSKQSLVLIDRSMQMLLVAFYTTIIAFITGVYLAVSSTVLWLAIVVIVICSLIGISMDRDLLFKVLLIPSRNKGNPSKPKQEDTSNDEENPSEKNSDDEEEEEESPTDIVADAANKEEEETAEEESEEDSDENDTDKDDSDEE